MLGPNTTSSEVLLRQNEEVKTGENLLVKNGTKAPFCQELNGWDGGIPPLSWSRSMPLTEAV